MTLLTQDFNETVQARAQREPAFRLALVEEAIATLLEGDLETAQSILGNYINATMGYPVLAELTGKNSKSLIRILQPSGNPTSRNLLQILRQICEHEGVKVKVQLKRR